MWNSLLSITTQITGSILAQITKSFLDPIKSSFSSAVQMVQSTWDSALKAIGSAAEDLWKKLVGGSIWTDMLNQMVSQTQDAMSAIQGEFGQGLIGPSGAVSTFQAARPAVASAGPTSYNFNANIPMQSSIYLDGELIQRAIQQRTLRQIAVQRAAIGG
jgi:hypothetical protein